MTPILDSLVYRRVIAHTDLEFTFYKPVARLFNTFIRQELRNENRLLMSRKQMQDISNHDKKIELEDFIDRVLIKDRGKYDLIFFRGPEDYLFTVQNEDGEVVGIASLVTRKLGDDSPVRYGTIYNVYLKKEYRKIGAGHKLIREIIEFAKKDKYTFLLIEAIKNNKKAINLYRRMGFTPYHEHTDRYSFNLTMADLK